ncbi:MAG: hypothetical protein AB8I69_11660 [Anaerolineae bacterium]
MKPELFEDNTHSFVVKIWLERTAKEISNAAWRGHVTHVPSGERCYIKNLHEILSFIAPYLEKMGVKPSLYRRVKRWLQQRPHLAKKIANESNDPTNIVEGRSLIGK